MSRLREHRGRHGGRGEGTRLARLGHVRAASCGDWSWGRRGTQGDAALEPDTLHATCFFLQAGPTLATLAALGSLQEEQARTHRWLPELTPRVGRPHPLMAKTGLGLAHALGRPLRPWSARAALCRALIRLRLRVTPLQTCRRPALPSPLGGPRPGLPPHVTAGAATAVRATPRREDAPTRTASDPAAAPGTTCPCRLSPMCLHRTEPEL